MENAGYVALSSQMVLDHQMGVIANNIANLSTPAYKGEELMFVEYLDDVEQDSISYVQGFATVRNLSAGPISPTHNPLDLAIPAEGYFVIETDEGPRYTRAGNFSLDADGQLVTPNGGRVLNDAGAAITIPDGAVHVQVARDGTISTEEGRSGRVQVVRFEDQQALLRRESNLYEAEDQVPLPVEDPEVVQGMLEGSNVVGVLEITRLIDTMRSYQAAHTLVKEENRLQQDAIEGLVDTSA